MTLRRAEMVRLPFRSPGFAQAFDAAAREIGFLAVTDVQRIRTYVPHGAGTDGRSIEMLKGCIYDALDTFAALPPTVLQQYHVDPTGQRGYTPAASEASGNYTEFRRHLMYGRQLPVGHPLLSHRPLCYQPNVLVAELPALEPEVQQLLDMLHVVTLQCFADVETYLGLPFGELAAGLACGQSYARLHIYPAVEQVTGHRMLMGQRWLDDPNEVFDNVNVVDGIVDGVEHCNLLRAGPHTDVGYWTWLIGSAVSGLKVKARDGTVLAFTTDPDTLVANVCDFSAAHIGPAADSLNGWRTSYHWVDMTPETAVQRRLSIANFVHTRPNVMIAPWDGRTPAMTAAELLFRRLWEIHYLTPDDRDALIAASAALPADQAMIGPMLMWEQEALARGAIVFPELGQFYHVCNPKSGAWERKTAADGPMRSYFAS